MTRRYHPSLGVAPAFAGVYLALAAATGGSATAAAPPPITIPAASATALDGHVLRLPNDLAPGATILIVGFGRNSADSTTAWEKPVLLQLTAPGIAFYDLPMLAEVPAFVRPAVIRAIRNKVPDMLRPNFAPLTTDAGAWKRIAAYTPAAPDAAYVLLVDRTGRVLWQTHNAFNPPQFAELASAARKLAQEAR